VLLLFSFQTDYTIFNICMPKLQILSQLQAGLDIKGILNSLQSPQYWGFTAFTNWLLL